MSPDLDTDKKEIGRASLMPDFFAVTDRGGEAPCPAPAADRKIKLARPMPELDRIQRVAAASTNARPPSSTRSR